MSVRTRYTPYIFGVLTAAFIGIAVHDRANAATRFTFGPLVLVTQDNAIDNSPIVSKCTDPDSNARVTYLYNQGWLKFVAAQSSHTNPRVQIDLDSVGNLLQARIADSSGNTFLDDQALFAARGSMYAPEVHNCTSFKRSYVLDIMFGTPTAPLPQIVGGNSRRFIQ